MQLDFDVNQGLLCCSALKEYESVKKKSVIILILDLIFFTV